MRYEYLGRDWQSNRGFFSSLVRGVWMPLCPLQSIPLLSQTPDQPGHCSAVAVCRLSKPHS
jgi:hypothetical protein